MLWGSASFLKKHAPPAILTEYTPGVMMRQVGRNTFRLGVKGDPDLKWSFLDVVLERGNYTLRWLGKE